MAFKIIIVNESFLARQNGKSCRICTDKLNLKLNDVIVIKTTRASHYAHPNCAVKHNWVSKREVDKILITS